MASKEELEAMGITVKQCKECCKDIPEEEYNSHKGYCKSCYNDRYNIVPIIPEENFISYALVLTVS